MYNRVPFLEIFWDLKLNNKPVDCVLQIPHLHLVIKSELSMEPLSHMGPLLLTLINFNPSMGKESHAQ